METTKEITIYSYEDLDEEAQERARDWYKGDCGLGYEWWESAYEDAKTAGSILGINIDQIYFSGFWSQGDGACFEGSYGYAKGAVEKIREYTGDSDGTLAQIAKDLQEVQRRAFYKLSADVKQSGRYSHEFCTDISVYDERNDYAKADDDDGISEALRDFMRWIYNLLEREYEWLNSDEVVAENITSNQYEFNEDGSPA